MKLNRKLKMGMVGGGPGAFIGEVHRKAARMDGGIELGDCLPSDTDTYDCGTAAKKWANVFCTTLTEGDHVCEELECAICEESFKKGQNLVYHVIAIGKEGTRTIPAHITCAEKRGD